MRGNGVTNKNPNESGAQCPSKENIMVTLRSETNTSSKAITNTARNEVLTNATAAKQAPASLVGHTFTTRFNYQLVNLVVVYQYQERGMTHYVLSSYNADTRRFLDWRSDSYFLAPDRTQISPTALDFSRPENAKYQAMYKALRISMLIGKVKQAFREVDSGLVPVASLTAYTSYRSRFEMEDKTGYFSTEGEPEFLFGNPKEKERLLIQWVRLAEAYLREMRRAGLIPAN
jgi:hypothetical protein